MSPTTSSVAPAAYGDLGAAVLAFVALAALRAGRAVAIPVLWVFNLWGFLDLLNAVVRASSTRPTERWVRRSGSLS